MNCFKCATPIPDSSRFCLSCGTDVSGDPRARTLPSETGSDELERMVREAVSGDYQLERELGRGGMAVVYLAHEAQLNRKVAIKALPPDLGLGAGLNERFLREARTAAGLDHPHIIPIYKVGSSDKILWYAMKYIEGQGLNDILEKSGPLPIDAVRTIISQTAGALGHAHRQNVIHRDVKPANIMLNQDGWVIVTDFGIAKAMKDSSLTGSGSVLGTPYYMSPEQCEGKQITPAADQYSLAVVTYQLLTGHLPFDGDTLVEIIKKHCLDTPPPVELLRPETPPAMRKAIRRALEKKPASRFPSVTDFAAALGATAGEAPIQLSSLLPAGHRVSATALAPVAHFGPQARFRTLLRLRVLVPLSVLLAASVAGGVYFGLLRSPAAQEGAARVQTTPDTVAAIAPILVGNPRTDSTSGADSTPATAAPAGTGRILIAGLPPGAAVTVDGLRVRGARSEASPGQHQVRASASGYVDWTAPVTVVAGQTARLTFAGTSTATGRVIPPAATPVEPSAVRLAPTPATGQPATGQPTPSPSPAQAPTEQARSAAGPPSTTGGFLVVTASGAFGAVHVDDRLARAQTPLLNYPLSVGTHTVRVERAGFETQQQQVTIAAGDTARVRFVMRPSGQGARRDTTP